MQERWGQQARRCHAHAAVVVVAAALSGTFGAGQRIFQKRPTFEEAQLLCAFDDLLAFDDFFAAVEIIPITFDKSIYRVWIGLLNAISKYLFKISKQVAGKPA